MQCSGSMYFDSCIPLNGIKSSARLSEGHTIVYTMISSNRLPLDPSGHLIEDDGQTETLTIEVPGFAIDFVSGGGMITWVGSHGDHGTSSFKVCIDSKGAFAAGEVDEHHGLLVLVSRKIPTLAEGAERMIVFNMHKLRIACLDDRRDTKEIW